MNVTHFAPGQLIIRDVRFNHHLVNAAKAVPGMRWDPVERGWVGYTDAVSLVLQALNAKGVRVAASEDVQKLIVEPHSEYEKDLPTLQSMLDSFP